MTCIVALIQNNKVHMAGDSAAVSGQQVIVREDAKVFHLGPMLVGYTSSFRMGQLIRFGFHPFLPDENDSREEVHEYMVTTFIESIRERFRNGGWMGTDDEDGGRDSGGNFMVGFCGNIFTIGSDYQVGIPRNPYYAIGCGAKIALGSLHTSQGLDWTPEKRLQSALESATEYSTCVRPPFLYIEELRSDKPAKKTKNKKSNKKI